MFVILIQIVLEEEEDDEDGNPEKNSSLYEFFKSCWSCCDLGIRPNFKKSKAQRDS